MRTPLLPTIMRLRPTHLVLLTLVLMSPPIFAQDETGNQAALAIYADAANFQTNGAIDLAVENWKDFLAKFPDHQLAPKAAHYLGVCYMQQDPPDLLAAAKAFDQALGGGEYDLREESLSNQGWCYYAAAGSGDQNDASLLNKAIKTYQTLLKKNPNSRYRDRAFFYSGEAAYTLGDLEQATKNYDQLLQMDNASQSPLRCEAMYARGVAQEELKQYDKAAASYQQLLDACQDSEHVVDVFLRMGDIQILSGNPQAAIDSFEQVVQNDSDQITDEDRAFALLRQGFAFAKLSQPDQAAARYSRLIDQYPQSQYAAAATLAAAQTHYQAGDLEKAAERFQDVLAGNDAASSTEAAHWLARINLARASDAGVDTESGQQAAAAAFAVADRQLKAGAKGEYATNLALDAAEALSLQDDQLPQALKRFADVADQASDPSLQARAVYNAGFTALQLGDNQAAIGWADRFAQNHAADPLAADAMFIAAEANLIEGKAGEAAKLYRQLVESPAYQDNSQRGQWIVRAATALSRDKQYEVAASLVARHLDDIQTPDQRAEALLIAGQAQLRSGQAEQAAESFKASREAAPDWARSDEAFLLAGQAQMSAGNRDIAIGIWNEIVRDAPETGVADQARYKLGQLASTSGKYEDAINHFQPIIESGRVESLQPFARYAMGWAQMQAQRYAPAAETLTRLIDENQEHPLYDDALLARGISQRNLENLDAARADLESFLETQPSDVNLGHALYELALIDQNQNAPAEAAKRLQQIVTQVPDYPDMDKVLYELGWSLKESDQSEAAIAQFSKLIEQYPDNDMVGEAAYFVGQEHYANEAWPDAQAAYLVAADKAPTTELKEKSLYRLGWSYYRSGDFPAAEAAFIRQYAEVPGGSLYLDSMMMIGESRFKQDQFETALRAYSKAREKIQADDDTAQSLRDPAERQVRELILLHGGQSAAQLTRWDHAIEWYDELRQRFPATTYLPQVFYETGFAHQQAGDNEQAMKLYSQVADNYRNELAARARFMMGEIHFAANAFDKAIPEFQRVMFGFGAGKAPPTIKNWQAKSGFEAGRCSELLMENAKTQSAKAKARDYAVKFYQFVVDQHPTHELVGKAKARVSQLQAINP